MPCRATDETYVRVGGKWRYLWLAVDQKGQFIDFRLTAKRDAKAAKAFLKQAIGGVRLYRLVSICTPSRDIADAKHCRAMDKATDTAMSSRT